MSFAIIAEFPLGTYRGRRPDGGLDRLPSPARLHAALLAAAGAGVRAESADDQLLPCDADRSALTWFEEHAPDAIATPLSVLDPYVATAYRAEGFFGVRDAQRVLASRSDTGGVVAFGAPLAWVWNEPPPDGVAAALAALCLDVSHLGPADSPVRLRVGAATPTHRLDRDASPFAGSGLDVEVPRHGRTATLEAAFARTPHRPPSAAGDRCARAENAQVRPVERRGLSLARYVPLVIPRAPVPWSTVVLLPVDRNILPENRVAWCVATHRALISLIGDGAPTLVTGRYEAGVERPANRLAIQYISMRIPAAPLAGTHGAIALLIPADAEPADLAALDHATRELHEVRLGARGRLRRVGEPLVVDGADFWTPVAEGRSRVWVTDTAATPESRPPRGRPWTIGDAALLSVGLVFRDRFPHPEGRADWYATLLAGVDTAGVRVFEAHKLNSAAGVRYVHRVTPEAAIQPYRAALSLGGLVGNRTILAIGQSRHLGGGLLSPLDLPDEWIMHSTAGSES